MLLQETVGAVKMLLLLGRCIVYSNDVFVRM
jgi:hypothetical protein